MNLTIEKLIYGGSGLARAEGKAIFVPFTLPVEVVEAEIISDRGSYAEAELVRILESAPERITAPCRYFGVCGGCHYQHSSYTQQLEIKKQILNETLERARLPTFPEISVLSAEPFRYRNRSRFHIDRSTSKLCYKKRATHEDLAVDVCPISAPHLEQTLQLINANAGEWQLAKHFDEIELFTNAEQGGLLLTLWSRANAATAKAALEKLWSLLKQQIPQLAGAAAFSVERGTERSRLLASQGEQSLDYTAANRSYRVSIGSFFQVNSRLVEPLVTLVTKKAHGRLAWDLYAGVGLFARALLDSFEQVVAVESAPASVQDLRQNLSGGAHRIVSATTLAFLRRARTLRDERPELVIVDPPRAGLGKEVTALLGEIRPAHITYVSCDPATLSRDLKSLLDSGYSVNELHMVDMFPQTFHIETVAMLSLK